MIRFVLLLLVALGTSAPRAAIADRAEAARMFAAGEDAVDRGDYLTAIRAFRASFEAEPHPHTSFALAQAYRQQYLRDRDAANAREALGLYQRFTKESAGSPWRPVADAYVIELLAVLAREPAPQPSPPPPPPPTQLMVRSNTPGARIFLDDETRAIESPAIQTVSPGDHAVRVEAPGHATDKRILRAIAERLVVADIDLAELPGALQVFASEDGAAVYIDGQPVGIAPIEREGLRAGSHTVTVARRGREVWSATVAIDADQRSVTMADLTWSTQAEVAKFTAIGSAALAVSAGIAGLLALRADSGLTGLPQGTNEQRSAHDDQLRARNDLSLASNLLLAGAGLALAVAGFVYWFDVPDVSH